MSKQVNDIQQAFTAGSGIASGDMIALAMVTIIGCLLVMVISVLNKRLSQFRRDEDAYEVLKVTAMVFLTFLLVLTITQFVTL